MKNLFTTLILSVFAIPVIAQNWYSLESTNSIKLKKVQVNNANSLTELLPNYPGPLWIQDFESITISTQQNGKDIIATNHDKTFSAEQKELLSNLDVNNSIRIKLRYRYINPVSGEPGYANSYLIAPVVPDVEAQFPTGAKAMTAYLNENVLYKFNGTDTIKKAPPMQLSFVVNEEGKVTDAKVIGAIKADEKFQNLLLEAFNNMPTWKPAENSAGTKVKQEFKLYVFANSGKNGC
jgi:hypothetical protein